MNIGIIHLAGAVAAAILILGLTVYLLIRRSKPAYPVKCIHCLQYHQQDIIVTYSSKPGQWAICPECVKEYWNLEER